MDLRDDHIRSTESDSPASGSASEQQLPDNKESSSPENLENYANIRLVSDASPPYAPSVAQQQDSRDMPGFSVSDHFFGGCAYMCGLFVCPHVGAFVLQN